MKDYEWNCKKLQNALVQFLGQKEFLRSIAIVPRGVGGLEHEQKLTTRKGRTLCVFHPIPQKLVENLGELCLEQLSVQLALGTDVHDNNDLLDLAEQLATSLHGQYFEVLPWSGVLMLQSKSPWSEIKTGTNRQWVQIHFLAL